MQIKKFSKCKSCGRNTVGSMEIKGSIFFRSCKCGWVIRIYDKK